MFEKKNNDIEVKKNNKEKIVKKNIKMNIGSKNGGKDIIVNLEKGKPLPKEIPDKFFNALKKEGII